MLHRSAEDEVENTDSNIFVQESHKGWPDFD
jgi:hypothetical protein